MRSACETARRRTPDDEGHWPSGDGSYTSAPETNWLPTPASREFTMCLRLYQPAGDALTGSWNPPPLTPAKSTRIGQLLSLMRK